MLRSPRKRRFASLSTAALTAVGVLALPIAGGQHRADGHFISTARAEAQAQDKIRTRVRKFNKDVKSLIGRLRGELPEGFAKTNGRIEATEIDVSSKYAGRLQSVMVDEGDEVKAGQVIAVIYSPEYEAQLLTAKANVLVASSTFASAEAKVAQAKADQIFAQRDLERGKPLVAQGWLTRQLFEQRVDKADAANAALEATEKQRDAAKSAVEAAQAEVERIHSILTDLTIISPRDGRVQYRIHRAGEVVNAGERIVQILDLNDVYMTIYLPSGDAGRLAIGNEARLILDPFPELVIPAYVSFVATEAQFTPKPVETTAEREKLIFRVKLQVDPEVLRKYHTTVKTGIRGMGFVRTSPSASWPENLAVKLPEEQPESSPDQNRKRAGEDQSKQ